MNQQTRKQYDALYKKIEAIVDAIIGLSEIKNLAGNKKIRVGKIKKQKLIIDVTDYLFEKGLRA